ncbi:MAG: hypothetical protein J1F39_03500 [Clostridiales bacterium]|nr:hypothetical protein [Clostridiales bacterium]
MRKLTIKRTKSFIGCAAKMKIYIEDSSASELTINNVPCRKIGEVKNGEEKTFEIGEQAAKVYVIADTMSKEYCNDFYVLPEGQDDVYLTGKNRFSLASGNAFRFDNNNNEEALANRKRGTKKGVVVLVVAIAIGAVVGFLLTSFLLRF